MSVNLRGITFNTHAGGALGRGLYEVLDHDPDYVLLQELRDIKWVRRVAPASVWSLTAHRGAGDKVGVLARRDRLHRVAFHTGPITKGPEKGMHPARYRAHGRFYDFESRRNVHLYSVHTWYVPNFRTDNRIRKGHVDQIQTNAIDAKGRPAEAVVVAGGDFNQRLDRRLPFGARRFEATRLMGEAGLRSSAEMLGRTMTPTANGSAVDEIFVRPSQFVAVARRHVFDVNDPNADHAAVLVDLAIAPRRSP